MKRNFHISMLLGTMQINLRPLQLILAAAALGVAQGTLPAAEPEATAKPQATADTESSSVAPAAADAIVDAAPDQPEFSNWIDFTIGGAVIRGDETAMMRRTRSNGSDVFGGIGSAQLVEEIDESTTLTFNGHALTGLEDYEFNVDLESLDWGFIKAGYKQFRTWYDATGGYFPGANMSLGAVNGRFLFDDERYIDRGEAYFTAGLRLENLPEITFSYRHLFRDGQKDSTSWGDISTTGGINPLGYKLLPALWNINESTDIFELDIAHTIGKTDLELGFVYENYDVGNTRYTPRWGSIPTGVGTGSTPGLVNTNLTETTHGELFASHLASVTRFNDKAWLSYAASFSSMDTNIDGGSRTYGVYYPNPVPAGAGIRDYAYDQMTGGANVKQFSTNLNFMAVPLPDLTITPSVRYENENSDMLSYFRAFNSNQAWRGFEALGAFTDMDSYAGAIDIRYSGLNDLVLYGKAMIGREDEQILRQDRYLPGEFLATGVDIDENEYMVGANWYALNNLSFSVQALHSTRDQSLNHVEGNQAVNSTAPGGANNFRPIMTEHDTETDDLNFRVTYRPLSNLSLVTRYDYAHTEFDNAGINWSLPAAPILYPILESGDIRSHIVSQSVTWNPVERLYLQGTASWISSLTDTPEDLYTGDFRNDYLAGTLSAGYAIDSLTDISAEYTYYGAGNYSTGLPGMVYGLNTEEHAINVTLSRLLAPNKLWHLRYGFITSNTDPSSDQFGGFNDFDAHMVSTGLQIRF